MRPLNLPNALAAVLTGLRAQSGQGGFIGSEAVESFEETLRVRLPDSLLALFSCAPAKLSHRWNLLSLRASAYESTSVSGNARPAIVISRIDDADRPGRWAEVTRRAFGNPDPYLQECAFQTLEEAEVRRTDVEVPQSGKLLGDKARLSTWLLARGVTAAPAAIEFSTGSAVAKALGIGLTVRHPTFGDGEVLASRGDLLEIRFGDGIRKLKRRFVTNAAPRLRSAHR